MWRGCREQILHHDAVTANHIEREIDIKTCLFLKYLTKKNLFKIVALIFIFNFCKDFFWLMTTIELIIVSGMSNLLGGNTGSLI